MFLENNSRNYFSDVSFCLSILDFTANESLSFSPFCTVTVCNFPRQFLLSSISKLVRSGGLSTFDISTNTVKIIVDPCEMRKFWLQELDMRHHEFYWKFYFYCKFQMSHICIDTDVNLTLLKFIEHDESLNRLLYLHTYNSLPWSWVRSKK